MIELRQKYSVQPIVLMRSKGPVCKYFDDNNIKYLISHFYWWVFIKNRSNTRVHEVYKQLKNKLKVKQILKEIKEYKIDLIYTNSVTVNIGTHISKRLNCNHIWHLRESMAQFNFKFSLGTRCARKHFRNQSNQFISISNYVSDSYSRLIPKDKISTIYNGIPIPFTLRNLNQVEDNFNVCILGLISAQKNQKDALEAIRYLVREKKKDKIILYVIGSGDRIYTEELKDFIIKHKLEENIRLTGHQDNIDEALVKMNLGLMCSHDEAFGRVTIEYMINRMPVIASNSGANPELIKQGKNGILYTLYQPIELAEQILKFIEYPELLEKYGSFAQQEVLADFSSDKNTTKIYQLIEKFIKYQ
jgi:glycosyltransferase involved in cell wall biosynthesis